jgi:hypothetical protein
MSYIYVYIYDIRSLREHAVVLLWQTNIYCLYLDWYWIPSLCDVMWLMIQEILFIIRYVCNVVM